MPGSGGVSYLWQGTRLSADMLAGSGFRAGSAGVPNGKSLASWEQVNFGVARRFDLPKGGRSEEHTSELQSHLNLVCRLLLEKKKIVRRVLSRLLCLCPKRGDTIFTPFIYLP